MLIVFCCSSPHLEIRIPLARQIVHDAHDAHDARPAFAHLRTPPLTQSRANLGGYIRSSCMFLRCVMNLEMRTRAGRNGGLMRTLLLLSPHLPTPPHVYICDPFATCHFDCLSVERYVDDCNCLAVDADACCPSLDPSPLPRPAIGRLFDLDTNSTTTASSSFPPTSSSSPSALPL
jgi:hypothetical protein